jgi:apolipoprotein N-acyltransferase
MDYGPRTTDVLWTLRDLRRRRIWVGIGIASLVLLVFLSFAMPPEGIRFVRSGSLWHFPAYLAVMFWFGALFAGRGTHHRVAVLLIVLQVALECVQEVTGMGGLELRDMAAGAAGVAAGWGLAGTRVGEVLVWVEGGGS